MAIATPPDASGPVFISYRWADGADHAKAVARRLRSCGVPVWLDRDDLPPGELATRLQEALASGLSGAVMVATPKVGERRPSDSILDIEAPTIFGILDKSPEFTTAILNTALTAEGEIDRSAPARWYSLAADQNYLQFSPVDGGDDLLGPGMATDRLRKMRAHREDSIVTIDLQTRVAATSFAHTADLIFRTIPPVNGRVPSRAAFEDLAAFVGWLPRALVAEGAREVRLLGGAHLSAACALGAALPETSGLPLTVRATDGDLWRLALAAPESGAISVDRREWRGTGEALAAPRFCAPLAATK